MKCGEAAWSCADRVHVCVACSRRLQVRACGSGPKVAGPMACSMASPESITAPCHPECARHLRMTRARTSAMDLNRMPLEILHRALVLLRRRARGESAEIRRRPVSGFFLRE